MSLADLMILLLIWIPLILLAVFTLVDLSRRGDLSSIAVGLWAVAIVLLPIAGMLIYFGTRPETSTDNAPASSDGSVDEAVLAKLERLGGLHESGVITDDELTAMKMQILE